MVAERTEAQVIAAARATARLQDRLADGAVKGLHVEFEAMSAEGHKLTDVDLIGAVLVCAMKLLRQVARKAGHPLTEEHVQRHAIPTAVVLEQLLSSPPANCEMTALVISLASKLNTDYAPAYLAIGRGQEGGNHEPR